MSVLIKGLEMPETEYMDVRIFRDGTAAIATGTKPYYRELKAEPVRHGHWIETEENHGFDDEVRNKALACSVCRVAFRISDYEQIEDFRYCPNCGADMR